MNVATINNITGAMNDDKKTTSKKQVFIDEIIKTT
jgi:hypothetical protein